jgi:Xaa-Pro aminopeptidase
VTDRLGRCRRLLDELAIDGLVVSDAIDVRYLSGFRGQDAMLIVGRESASICTDSRYWAQVREEVSAFELVKTDLLLADVVKAAAAALGAEAALGFQGGHLSHAEYRALRRLHRGRLRDVKGRVGLLRQVKDAGEIAAVRRACGAAVEALSAVVAQGLVGRAEAAVAWQIKEELHRLGAEGESFAAIVAAGPNGALAHAIPGPRRIGHGELVVVDMGARVDGYCSDLTRTFATGELDDELRRVYDVVLAAQLAGLAAVRPGTTGRRVDAAARGVIDDAGYGASFGHGTGHGVGLEVHEEPRLNRRGTARLRPGMVLTVEPGVYLEGRAGVRIEDTVLVTEDGREALTAFPKEFSVVA